jgi:hypothetical protein
MAEHSDDFQHPLCVLCEQRIAPDDMRLTCPRAMGRRRRHEVLNAPPWRPGDPVRPGFSLHPKGCEQATTPSVYADLPCTCHALGPALIGSSDGPVRDG